MTAITDTTATTESTTPSGRTRRLVTWTIVIIMAAIAHVQVFGATYVFDDIERVEMESSIRALPDVGEVLGATRRPIVNLTLAFNYEVAGKDEATGNPSPLPFHIFNLLVHIMTAMLLLELIARSLALARGHSTGRDLWIAGIAVGLWAVHPYSTACVPYIIQRGESMAVMFVLGALLALSWSDRERGRRSLLIASVVLVALAMLTKAVAVTAPILLLLYDRCFIAKSFPAALRARWIYHAGNATTWLLLAATGVVQGIFSTNRTANATVGFSYAARDDGLSAVEYLCSQPEVLLHYLRSLVWPAAMSLDYGWTYDPTWWTTTAVIIVWRAPALGFVAMTFFIWLGPTSSIIPIKDLAYDHRMYLPSACVMTLIVLAIWRSVGPNGRIASAESGVLLGAIFAATFLSAMTMQRTRLYHDPLTMWADVVAKRPHNPRGWLHVGVHTFAGGRRDQLPAAAAALDEAIRLDPDYARAHLNLGSVYGELGQYEKAIPSFERYQELEPNRIEGWLNLGQAYLRVRPPRIAEAIDVLQQALDMEPKNAMARQTLALAYAARAIDAMNRGAFDVAIPDLERAVELAPDFTEAKRMLDDAQRGLEGQSASEGR